MSEIFLTIIVVVGITAVLSYFSLKQKNSSWKGELIKKNKKSVLEEGGFDREIFNLIFKDKAGKKHKIQVKQGLFDKFDVGQKVVKKKGEYLPHKV